MSERQLFIWVARVAVVLPFTIAISGVILGGVWWGWIFDMHPEAVANPDVDSIIRFSSTIFAGVLVLIVIFVGRFEQHYDWVKYLGIVIFLGGIDRVVSIFVAGVPKPVNFIVTGLELAALLLILWMRRLVRIARQSGSG